MVVQFILQLPFHASMTFALVFLFSEETGDLFSMKVIALSTTIVGVSFIILSLIIRAIVYKTTKQSLDEVDPNNYLSHIQDEEPSQEDTSSTSDHDVSSKDETKQQEIDNDKHQSKKPNKSDDAIATSDYKEDASSVNKETDTNHNDKLKIIQLIPKIDTHQLSTMLKMKFTKLKIIKPTQINHINN